MSPQEIIAKWQESFRTFGYILGEIYKGDFLPTEYADVLREVKVFSEEMAAAAKKAKRPALAVSIKAHFREAIQHPLTNFERILSDIRDIKGIQKLRRQADSEIAYQFHSEMIMANIAEVEMLIRGRKVIPGSESGLYHRLKMCDARDDLFNSDLTARLGVVELQPATRTHKEMGAVLYSHINNTELFSTIGRPDSEGDRGTYEEKDAYNRAEVTKASLIARRLNCNSEDAMRLFVDFAEKNFQLANKKGMSIEGFTQVLINYATFAYFYTPDDEKENPNDVGSDEVLRSAFEHDFDSNDKKTGLFISGCHNRTVHYLWTGHDLETAQYRAEDYVLKNLRE